MIPTPSTSHVCFDRIYEPAEDSFLFLDTLSSPSEKEFLTARFANTVSSPVVLEVGTGSGVVLAFLTAHCVGILGRGDILSIGVDVNSFACRATNETVHLARQEQLEQGQRCGVYLDTVAGDLGCAWRDGSVDVLVFNPPYVPTSELPSALDGSNMQELSPYERDSNLLALSYAGGCDGMETTNRLLDELPRLLSAQGCAYVLLCAQNKPLEVCNRIKAWGTGWQSHVVAYSGKSAGWEKLQIIRICRSLLHTQVDQET